MSESSISIFLVTLTLIQRATHAIPIMISKQSCYFQRFVKIQMYQSELNVSPAIENIYLNILRNNIHIIMLGLCLWPRKRIYVYVSFKQLDQKQKWSCCTLFLNFAQSQLACLSVASALLINTYEFWKRTSTKHACVICQSKVECVFYDITKKTAF